MVCNRIFFVVALLVCSAIPLKSESTDSTDTPALEASTMETTVASIKDSAVQNDSPPSTTNAAETTIATDVKDVPIAPSAISSAQPSLENATIKEPTRRPSMPSTNPPLEHTTGQASETKNSANFYNGSLTVLLVTLLPLVSIY